MTAAHEPARRRNRVVVTVALAGALALGGGAVAYASGSSPSGPTPSPTTSPTPSTSHRPWWRGEAPTDGAAPARVPHIVGTVTRVEGATVTVKDVDGFTRTIKTTASTSYGDGSAGETLTAGALVIATGTVDADGTTLDATKILVAGDKDGRGWDGQEGWGGWRGEHPGPWGEQPSN